jgi:hypothetical protein
MDMAVKCYIRSIFKTYILKVVNVIIKMLGNIYKIKNSFSLAAKNAEVAGNMLRDLKKLKEAAKQLELAAKYLLEGGKYERSCQLYVKTAK